MSMIVSKFGGSSLCDASHIKKVADILKSDPLRVVAVVSAPGKEIIKIQKLPILCIHVQN